VSHTVRASELRKGDVLHIRRDTGLIVARLKVSGEAVGEAPSIQAVVFDTHEKVKVTR
jgi:hypothetical protein